MLTRVNTRKYFYQFFLVRPILMAEIPEMIRDALDTIIPLNPNLNVLRKRFTPANYKSSKWVFRLAVEGLFDDKTVDNDFVAELKRSKIAHFYLTKLTETF